MKKYYQHNPRLQEITGRLLADLYAEFGWRTRLVAPLIGLYVHLQLKREDAKLAAGLTYEPGSFFDKNPAALALEKTLADESKAAGRRLSTMPQPAPCLSTL
jgi:hypothetical protein